MGKELLGSLELNRIYQMDCLDGMKLIPDRSIDMILCDLPYGTTACKWDTIIPFEPLWYEYERIIKDNGAIVLTASQPFTTKLISSNLRLFKYCWYFNKNRATGHLNAKKMPMMAVEEICVFYKKLPTYNPQMIKRTEKELKRLPHKNSISKPNVNTYGNHERNEWDRYSNIYKHPNNILNFKVCDTQGKNKRVHPTQKPVPLFEYLIKTYTNEGEIVLDNCMGSGTTAVAATNLKRKWIGFEKEPKYIELANKRLDNLRGGE